MKCGEIRGDTKGLYTHGQKSYVFGEIRGDTKGFCTIQSQKLM